MEIKYQEELKVGLISTAISLLITYGVSLVYPTEDITWALIAVAFSAFFSGFFAKKDT